MTVHNLHKEQMNDEDVYVGRGGKGKNGYFGNPFSKGTRAENIDNFKYYLLHRVETDPEFRQRVKDLYGKRLFCFCAPLSCHGHLLEHMAIRLVREEDES